MAKKIDNVAKYAIDKVTTIGIVTEDGEFIDKGEVLMLKLDEDSRKKVLEQQKDRLYFKVFIDTLGNIYKLTKNEISVLFYINSHILTVRKKPDRTKLYFTVNQIFYEDCEMETGVPKESIKKALASLKDKEFISNYKSKKDDRYIKGAYVANPKYIYAGTPNDYVNDYFELQLKGIFISFD